MAYVYTRFSSKEKIMAYCAKRDAQIYAYSLKGWTLNELAEKYQITTQRVGQIIRAQTKLNRRSKKKAS